MADVPIYIAGESAQARMPSLIAQGSDFDSGFAVSQGLGQAANAAAQIGTEQRKQEQFRAAAAKQQKRMDDVRWSHESTFQLRRYLNEWMANPEVNTSEDFGAKFRETADQQVATYVKNAPSPEAELMFRERMDSFLLTKEDYALDLGMKTKISNTIESFQKQAQDSMIGFRQARTLPGSKAAGDLLDDLSTIKNGIKEAFALTPKLSGQLIGDIEAQFVNEASIANPDLAQILLDDSEHIPAEQRRILTNIIQSNRDTRDAQEVEAFGRIREDVLVNAAQTGSQEIPNPDEYKQVYGDERGGIEYERDRIKVRTAGRVHSWTKNTADLNTNELIRQFEYLKKDAKTAEDWEVLSEVQKQLKDQIELQVKDPVTWLQRGNKEIAQLNRQFETAVNEADKLAALGSLNDTILRYQGDYREGLPGKKESYLGRPINDIHMLSVGQAEQLANQINNSPPQKVLETFQQIFAQYPKNEHQIRALNDMVTLPPEGKGIRPEYQLILQNKDAFWMDTYIGSLQAGDSIKKLSTETLNKLEESIDSNPTWLAFQRSIAGDNLQRLPVVEAYRSGILNYANSIALQTGKPTAAAVGNAVDRLINESLGFSYVNGAPIAIPRQKPDGTSRSDEEIWNLGQRLTAYLEQFDPRDVDPKNPAFGGVGVLEGTEQAQAIRDKVTSMGFWQTSPDGQGAILYMSEPSGFVFQLVDKEGKPFTIDFENLPPLQTEERMIGAGFGGNIATWTTIKTPKKTYPLIQKSGGIVSTNWPAGLR